MADQARAATGPVDFLAALAAEPYRYGFFQAIRRIEAEFRDKARLGESTTAAEDPVRLGQTPSAAFAPATIAGFQRGTAGRPDRLAVYFFGLFGPQGPLPLHLTDFAHDRIRNAHDTAFASFADVFHHRMLSLFYRAWANAQPVVSYDRPQSDRFAIYVGSLFGLGMPAMRSRGGVADEIRLHFAGRLALQTRNVDGLEAMLAGYFETGVRVADFVGDWLHLPERAFSRLGSGADTCALGRTTVLGSRIWNRQMKIRITLGPLPYVRYRAFLPGGEELADLIELVKTYSHDEFAWDLRLLLRGDDVRPLQLGVHGDLGRTAWLPSTRPRENVDDLVFDPVAAEASSTHA